MSTTPPNGKATAISDDELLALFSKEPLRAWQFFLDRYADLLFRHLQRLGFDYDEAMDRFTYVCEKLSENEFRRLKSVRHTGKRGELTPWLRTVVDRLSISWLWSVAGRKRLFRSIEGLSEFAQRVFELHFRKGMTPGEIHEQLRVELQRDVSLAEVFEALETVFARLSPNKIWRLLSQLSRSQGTMSIEGLGDEEGGAAWLELAAPEADPEEALLRREESDRAKRLLDRLEVRDRLIIRLRFDDSLATAQIAELLRVDEKEVRASLRASLSFLRDASEQSLGLSVVKK